MGGGGPTGEYPFGQRPGRGSPRQTQWNYTSNVDPEELFRTVFGDFGSSRARGGSIFDMFVNSIFQEPKNIIVTIDFLESARGTKKTINVDASVQCSSCSGTGLSSSKAAKCPYCNGSGGTTVQRGGMVLFTACSRCNGQGVLRSACLACAGNGYTVQTKALNITVSLNYDS